VPRSFPLVSLLSPFGRVILIPTQADDELMIIGSALLPLSSLVWCSSCWFEMFDTSFRRSCRRHVAKRSGHLEAELHADTSKQSCMAGGRCCRRVAQDGFYTTGSRKKREKPLELLHPG